MENRRAVSNARGLVQLISRSPLEYAPMEDQSRESPPSQQYRLQESTTCLTCGTAIGPRDRRLTWRIRDGDEIVLYHYCSDACVPASAPDPP